MIISAALLIHSDKDQDHPPTIPVVTVVEPFEEDPVIEEEYESVVEQTVMPIEDTPRKFSKYELECLSTNIFHEARGESEEGWLAVAIVTYNRFKSEKYPNTICGVVHQPYQFSWTIDKPKIKDWKTYFKVEKFSKRFLTEYIYTNEDFTNGSKFYHATHVQPSWSRSFIKTARIGNHIFYRSEG